MYKYLDYRVGSSIGFEGNNILDYKKFIKTLLKQCGDNELISDIISDIENGYNFIRDYAEKIMMGKNIPRLIDMGESQRDIFILVRTTLIIMKMSINRPDGYDDVLEKYDPDMEEKLFPEENSAIRDTQISGEILPRFPYTQQAF